jgi:hypothetical protein
VINVFLPFGRIASSLAFTDEGCARVPGEEGWYSMTIATLTLPSSRMTGRITSTFRGTPRVPIVACGSTATDRTCPSLPVATIRLTFLGVGFGSVPPSVMRISNRTLRRRGAGRAGSVAA